LSIRSAGVQIPSPAPFSFKKRKTRGKKKPTFALWANAPNLSFLLLIFQLLVTKGDIMGNCSSCSGGCGPAGGDYQDLEGLHIPYNKKKVKKLSKDDEQMMYR
jgi:hypothetical protein